MNARVARREATRALVAYVADATSTPMEAVDVRAPFADIGLSSRQVVRLAVVVEDSIGIEVAATVGFDHGSITRLVDFVVSESVASS